MKKFFISLVFGIFVNIFIMINVSAQECKIIKDYKDGSFLIQVGDKQLLAISEEQEKKITKQKQDLRDAIREIEIKTTLLADYEKIKAQYETVTKQQKEYIAELETLLQAYRKLAGEYKSLKTPWLTVDGGIGVTGKDTKPAAMIGIGIKNFRIWGFAQEKNAGGIVGVSFGLK